MDLQGPLPYVFGTRPPSPHSPLKQAGIRSSHTKNLSSIFYSNMLRSEPSGGLGSTGGGVCKLRTTSRMICAPGSSDRCCGDLLPSPTALCVKAILMIVSVVGNSRAVIKAASACAAGQDRVGTLLRVHSSALPMACVTEHHLATLTISCLLFLNFDLFLAYECLACVDA